MADGMAELVLVPDPTPEEVKERLRLRRAAAQRRWLARMTDEQRGEYRAHLRELRHAIRLADPEKAKSRDRESRRKMLAAKSPEELKAWQEESRKKCREYYRANRERLLAKISSGPRTKHDIRRARRYGLTHEQYMALYKEQGGLCAICDRPFARKRGNFTSCIDHDHATGVVRGLLCRLCNVGLGNFTDDTVLLLRACAYLDKYKKLNGN